MTKVCQVSQAISFHDENFTEVMQTEKLVLEAGQRFLARSDGLLPIQVVEQAKKALKETKVGDFAAIIRKHASAYVTAGQSSWYWNMVDAANFFFDATSSFWRYMTMEKRATSLKWAREHALEVK